MQNKEEEKNRDQKKRGVDGKKKEEHWEWKKKSYKHMWWKRVKNQKLNFTREPKSHTSQSLERPQKENYLIKHPPYSLESVKQPLTFLEPSHELSVSNITAWHQWRSLEQRPGLLKQLSLIQSLLMITRKINTSLLTELRTRKRFWVHPTGALMAVPYNLTRITMPPEPPRRICP